MSYILDALRRADSERDRGTVPGLHTQPVPVNVADADADTERRPRLWIGLVVAAFLALLSAVAWLLMERSATQDLSSAQTPAASTATVATVTPPPLAAGPAPTAAAAASTPTGGAAPQAAEPPAPTSAQARQARSAAADSSPATPARDRSARRNTESDRSAAAPPVPTAAKVTTKAPTSTDGSPRKTEPPARIYALSELPEEIRRALPATPVNGSVYSRSAANRMVVINGQVFHEGDQLADQLVLEEIRQKSAVLRFKGFRYQINFQ